MDVRDSHTRNFLKNQIPHTVGAIGALLIGASIAYYVNFFAGAFFLFTGGGMALLGLLRIYAVCGGHLIATYTKSIDLLAYSTIAFEAPTNVKCFRIVIQFEDVVERFRGEILLREVETSNLKKCIKLKTYSPSSIISMPQWLWRDKRIEIWPRGAYKLLPKPVVSFVDFRKSEPCLLELNFRLDSNFAGTDLEAKYPVRELELVEIQLRSR